MPVFGYAVWSTVQGMCGTLVLWGAADESEAKMSL